MKWVKQFTSFGSLASLFLIGLLAECCQATSPAPGDVIVEIKLGYPNLPLPSREAAPTPDALPSGNLNSATPSPIAYPTFNSQQLDRQLRIYLTYLAEFGPPDILIVGSSRSLQGIDPATLQQALAQHGHPNLRVFNFGINGATAQVVDWLLQRLLTPGQLPRLIVWGDGSRAFNNGRPDHTFNNIMNSQGQKRLSSGIHPAVPPTNRLELGRICMDLLPIQFPLQEPAPSSFSPHSVQVGSAGKSLACNQPLKFLIRPGVTSGLRPQPPRKFAESLGFQWVDAQFNPGSYFRQYPRVPGRFDADYRNFSLQGKQIRALENVASFAKRNHTPLIFVNLPLTLTYLDFPRSSYENQFSRRMQGLARSQAFVFQDLVTERSLNHNHYFADPSHINRYGAAAVANQISKELAITLAKLLPEKSDVSKDRGQESISQESMGQ
jgi:hypothetical protein